MLDGAPDAVKVACPVLAGGKAGDNIKGLPIGTCDLFVAEKAAHSAVFNQFCELIIREVE